MDIYSQNGKSKLIFLLVLPVKVTGVIILVGIFPELLEHSYIYISIYV